MKNIYDIIDKIDKLLLIINEGLSDGDDCLKMIEYYIEHELRELQKDLNNLTKIL